MRLLSVLRLGLEFACFFWNVVGAIAFRNKLSNLGQCNCGQCDRVSTHVSDQTNLVFAGKRNALIKFLRDTHRTLCVEAELPGGFLLQRGRCKRSGRIATTLTLGYAQYVKLARRSINNGFLNRARGGFIFEAELLDFFTFVANKPRRESLFILADVGLNQPVFARFERFDLDLALDDHAKRRALYASSRQAALDFFPKQWRQIETDEIIQSSTRLLCSNQVGRNFARVGYRIAHGLFRDFMKHDPMYCNVVENPLFLKKLH